MKSTKKLYAYSYMAVKILPVGFVTGPGVGYCSADSEDEAEQIAMETNKKRNKESDGFQEHFAQVMEITPEVLAKLGYFREVQP